MARPRTTMPDGAALAALIDGEGRLAVRVTPGARGEALTIDEGRLLAKVRARPEDGKATQSVRELLAVAFNIAPSQVDLLRGAASREKLFRIALGPAGTPRG